MIVAFTNCIAYPAKVNFSKFYRGKFHHSMLTVGLNKILEGKDLYPVEYDNEDHFFAGINIKDVSTIFWSPFMDQTGFYCKMTDSAGNLFPYCDEVTAPRFGLTPREQLDTIYSWWEKLDLLTKEVPRRVLILYPTKFLTEETPEKKRFKERIEESNAKALEILQDWEMLSIENPVQSDPWWAHFTEECRQDLFRLIESICEEAI